MTCGRLLIQRGSVLAGAPLSNLPSRTLSLPFQVFEDPEFETCLHCHHRRLVTTDKKHKKHLLRTHSKQPRHHGRRRKLPQQHRLGHWQLHHGHRECSRIRHWRNVSSMPFLKIDKEWPADPFIFFPFQRPRHSISPHRHIQLHCRRALLPVQRGRPARAERRHACRGTQGQILEQRHLSAMRSGTQCRDDALLFFASHASLWHLAARS